MSRKKIGSRFEGYNMAFFGTPEFAVHILEELEEVGIVPSIVVTQPDKPAGRGLLLAEPPVKKWALEKGIPVIQPKRLAAEEPDADILWNSEWDLFIVAAYGKILPNSILKLPHRGTLNVHPSLLPKYRGPSPIESQILADDTDTGVSIIVLDEEMDHGPILAQARITPEEWPLRASVLEEILAREGGRLLAESLVPYMVQELIPEPQDHTKATFTKKIEKEDGLIHIGHPMSDVEAYQNYLRFCAYDEWPGTYFFVERNGKKVRVKITDAEYKDGTFTPFRVIPEAKKEMNYEDFVRNNHGK